MNIKELSKKAIYEVTADDISGHGVPKAVPWDSKDQEMTQDEVDRIRNLNWEWYYNCYLYGDETIQVACKRCGRFNKFDPGQKTVVCKTCGEKCKRCEEEEE